jgi:hypothetical protein
MRKSKSSVSKAASYKEVGEFWDVRDLADRWGNTRKVKFDVQIESEVTYFPVEKPLSDQLQSVAAKKGTSADALLNRWIREKLREQAVQ